MKLILKEMVNATLGSFLGRLGLSLLLFLIGGAIFVVATYPSNFGQRVWNNPVYWADYPKLAPPSWSSEGEAKHEVFRSTTPQRINKTSSGNISEYRFQVEISSRSDPDFLSFSVKDIKFWKDSPAIEVSLEAGDLAVLLYQEVLPDEQDDEQDGSSPVVRFHDVPLRVQLTSDSSVKEEVREFLQQVREKGLDKVDAVVVVEFFDPRDSVGEVKFVAGGKTWGLLGTDNIGRDIWKGLLFGLPISLFIGFAVAFASTVIGATVGALSGYVGGFADIAIQKFIDVKSTIPTLPILIFLVFTVGPNLWNVILFMIVFSWMGLAIQLRPWIMQIKETGFIAIKRAEGFPAHRIIFRHLLPQTMPFLFANFVLTVPSAIITEAGLSFLGLGDPSIPTWGYLLEQGYKTGALYSGYWWWVVPPGAAIVFVSFAYFLLSMAWDKFWEPRLQGNKN